MNSCDKVSNGANKSVPNMPCYGRKDERFAVLSGGELLRSNRRDDCKFLLHHSNLTNIFIIPN